MLNPTQMVNPERHVKTFFSTVSDPPDSMVRYFPVSNPTVQQMCQHPSQRQIIPIRPSHRMPPSEDCSNKFPPSFYHSSAPFNPGSQIRPLHSSSHRVMCGISIARYVYPSVRSSIFVGLCARTLSAFRAASSRRELQRSKRKRVVS